MYRGILIFLSFLLFSSNFYPQGLSFIYERIEMTVYDSSFSVTGRYLFENRTDKEIKQSLYYPFVINNSYSYPDSISIINNSNVKLAYFKGKEGIFFPVKISPDDTSGFIAFYRQKNLSNKAEYILTTTQNWKNPLSKAEYVINLPVNFSLKYISLKPDSIKKSLNFNSYFINKKKFMPKTNLIVEWEGREK